MTKNNKKSSSKEHLTFQDIRIGLTVAYSSMLVDHPERSARYLNCIDTYVNLLESWRKSGLSVVSILHRVNVMKLHYVRYLGGNPLTQTFTEVKVTGGGLPTSISFMPLLSRDKIDIKFNLTILSATRAITVDCSPDIQPIVSTAIGLIPKDLYEFTDDWLNKVVDTTRKIAESSR